MVFIIRNSVLTFFTESTLYQNYPIFQFKLQVAAVINPLKKDTRFGATVKKVLSRKRNSVGLKVSKLIKNSELISF